MTSCRQLPPAEWSRLLDDGIEPFVSNGLPDPEHWRIIVAEQDGLIVGASILQEAVLNHWFVKPAARRSIEVVLGLWRETKGLLDEHGVRALHATVSNAQVEVQAMIERLGYLPAEGKLYVLDVEQAILNQKDQE